MTEWNLPSQKVSTDREEGEPVEQLQIRHETHRRLQNEADLIEALDMLDEIVQNRLDQSSEDQMTSSIYRAMNLLEKFKPAE